MNRFILLLIVGFLVGQNVQGQDPNPCGISWSEWRTAWNFSSGRVLYRLQFASKKCGCGRSFVQMQHDLPYKATVAIRLEGFDCDGKKYGERFTKDIANGEISSKGNDHHWFGSMPSPVYVEVQYEEGNKRIKLVGDQSGTRTYINGVSEQAYYQQQQQKASSGSSTSGGSSRKVVPGTAMPTIVFPADGASSGNSGGSGGNKSNGTNGTSGSKTTPNQPSIRTTGTSGTSGTTRQTSTQPKKPTGTTQQDIYKNTALADLQRSQQPGQSPITQAMHMSNAMITARASGDAATIQQVQQAQAQASAQNRQQLAETTTALAGSVMNLISIGQERKREREASYQRSLNDYQQRKEVEALQYAEIEKATAPIRRNSINQLQQLMEAESDEYGASSIASDKLIHSLSWLWKWNESVKILNTKPNLSYYSTNKDANMLSEGYLKPSPISLMPAKDLQGQLDLPVLIKTDLASKRGPVLQFPVDLPSKAKDNWRDLANFYIDIKNVSVEEAIDRNYIHLESQIRDNQKNEIERIKSLVGEFQGWRGFNYYIDLYNPDSVSCVKDGTKAYRYWPGKNSRSIYKGGYTPQKKLEAQLLYASILLDSAIIFQRPATLPRAAAAYKKVFDWYFSGPARWLNSDELPALLIRESMFRYAVAVAAARQNLKPTTLIVDPHASMTADFLNHFEQYCQSGISRETEPMNIKD